MRHLFVHCWAAACLFVSIDCVAASETAPIIVNLTGSWNGAGDAGSMAGTFRITPRGGVSGKLFAGSLTGGARANVVGRMTADAFELTSVDGSSLRLRATQLGAVVSGTFEGLASQGVWKGEWRLRSPRSIVAPEVQEKAGRGETQDIRVNLATRAMWYEAASQARSGSRLRPDVLGPRLATAYAEARAALAAKVGRSAEKLGPYQSGASSFVVDAASPAEISVLASSGMVASISPEPGERLEPNIDKSVVLIDQPEAQAAGYTGAGYAIAIVDSGIDYTKDVLAPAPSREFRPQHVASLPT